MVLGILTYSLTAIFFQSAGADDCLGDSDWPEKPCPGYGAESETELKQIWDKYYEMKGKAWMEMKKAEMDQAIKSGSFTEWIQYAPGNESVKDLANRNVYFYYRLNNQAPVMVLDSSSGEYAITDQDPSTFSYSPFTGDYVKYPPSPPWYASLEGTYAIIGIGTAGALALFFAYWKLKLK